MGNCCKVCDEEKRTLLREEIRKAEVENERKRLEERAAYHGICPNCVRTGLKKLSPFNLFYDYKCPHCGWKGSGGGW